MVSYYRIVKNQYGEWLAKAYDELGVYNEDCTYYGCDKEDCIATAMREMKRQLAGIKGSRVTFDGKRAGFVLI